jgi:hypothetical protein
MIRLEVNPKRLDTRLKRLVIMGACIKLPAWLRLADIWVAVMRADAGRG